MPAGYMPDSKVLDSMSEMSVDLERFRNKCCCSAYASFGPAGSCNKPAVCGNEVARSTSHPAGLQP